MTLDQRCLRACYYVGTTLYGKLRRGIFDLVRKGKLCFEDPLGDFVSDVLKAF